MASPDATEPMTAAQAKMLRRLCREQGQPFWPDATRRLAWGMIYALSTVRKNPTPAETRRVPCPTCRAAAGRPCTEPDGANRKRHHQARCSSARRVLVAEEPV